MTTRTKEAIKIGLAMAISYGIALQLGWEKPSWAGIAEPVFDHEASVRGSLTIAGPIQ